jgi:two-component system sensor histidine kinase BarA
LSNQEILHHLRRLPLLTKVCFFSFSFTFLLAVSSVSYQTFFNIQDHHDELERCIKEAFDPKLDFISEKVWKQDFDALSDFFNSNSSNCTSASESINPKDKGHSLFFVLLTKQGQRLEFGSLLASEHISKIAFALSYWKTGNNQNAAAYWLGELDVFIDYQTNYESIINEGLLQIFRHFLVSFAGTVLGFLLGYKMVIKRIRHFIKQLNSETSYEDLKEYIDKDKTELSSLWFSILNFKEGLDSKRLKTDIRYKQALQDMAKVQRESELKSQFLAKMSHELRTPMNGLLGFSTLLLESKLEDEQREYAQTIQASLESLLYVINDVLDLSRIESGDLNITQIPFSLRGVVSGVTALLKNRAEAKGLQFETRVSSDVPDTLRGDPVRIRQVIMNLAANAIRHTDKGYVLINVMPIKNTSSNDRDKAHIRIELEDSGLSVHQRIHKEQALLDAGFSSELRGKRSLGLDICFQLAELMGSQLCHESRDNGGSSYWFDLSLPKISQVVSNQLIDLSALKKIRVLVIDSYELSRKITLELLEEWGVRFEAKSNAGEALKLIQNYPENADSAFNMILCDDLLQDLSGIETCQRLRQVLPYNVPIVILCSNAQLGDAEGFYLSGANGFLSKQFRDPFLKSVMCQSFAERLLRGQDKRLITRYTVNDAQVHSRDLPIYKTLATVLIVESNIINQQLIMNMLEKNRCTVDIASNGFEAIELFKNNHYDLIFMDGAMPDMDGLETTLILREIEKSHTERKRTPIIAMTTNDIDGEADRCFQVGMDELMTKPLKIAKLEMVLGRYTH